MNDEVDDLMRDDDDDGPDRFGDELEDHGCARDEDDDNDSFVLDRDEWGRPRR